MKDEHLQLCKSGESNQDAPSSQPEGSLGVKPFMKLLSYSDHLLTFNQIFYEQCPLITIPSLIIGGFNKEGVRKST